MMDTLGGHTRNRIPCTQPRTPTIKRTGWLACQHPERPLDNDVILSPTCPRCTVVLCAAARHNPYAEVQVRHTGDMRVLDLAEGSYLLHEILEAYERAGLDVALAMRTDDRP